MATKIKTMKEAGTGDTIIPRTTATAVTFAEGPTLQASLGIPNGIATLDPSGLVPIAQLPSYVDDVIEFGSLYLFPSVGESGKIYVATDTSLTYRWSGTIFVEISPSLALGETSATAYRGDRGKIAFDGVALLKDTDIVEGSVLKSIKDKAQKGDFTPTVPSGIAGVTLETALVEVGTDVEALKGVGWVDESVKGNAEGILAINNLKLSTAITITVGTGGDYATINEALAYATTRYPVYVSASVQPRVTISLLTGFVMAEQVIVDGQDLSWITISSVGEFVITRSALTTASDNGKFPAFTAQNGAFLPIIATLFNMDTSGTGTNRHGIMAYNNSRVIVSTGCGVKNAGGSGIVAVYSSNIQATGADSSGATAYGVSSEFNSTINAVSVNAQKGASPASSDFSIYYGSFITKIGGTGGVSQTVNTLTANGIIFG